MSPRIRHAFLVVFSISALFAAHPTPAEAAVFQFAVPVTVTKGPPSEAFLWIPADARQVRGVVMAGMTLMERDLVKDSQIRRACASEGLAIVFLKCGLGAVDVQRVLDDLAGASGYPEISAAPLLFIGHSAGGPQAKALAIRMADRCIGLMQYRGGAPGGVAGDSVPAAVPTLMMIGQFDEFGGVMRDGAGRENWEGGRNALSAYRAADESRLAAIVVEPGAGHFAWSDRSAGYLSLWIQRAAHARIPADIPIDSKLPVKCKTIDHKSGWLSDPLIKAPGESPAPFEHFKGDRAKANWHFDESLARATLEYHNPPLGGFGKKDQFIQWKDPHHLDAGVRRFFSKIVWVGDGQTFKVHPEYAATFPKDNPDGKGPRWADAGKPVGHSAGPILVKSVGGPVVAAGPDTFRFAFDGLSPVSQAGRVTFLAFSAGDAEYRYTELVGMLPRGFSGLQEGKDQVITFPPPGELVVDGSPLPLSATSDSGLPVEYYIAAGPAVIEGGKIRVTELPLRAKFPITVKVVAHQFGRGLAPLVKTAAPVEHMLQLKAR